MAEEALAIGAALQEEVSMAEHRAEQLPFRSRAEGGGRRLLVAMKLTTSSREMLTWTIAKLAQPGDHILALHVSARPLQEGERSLSLRENFNLRSVGYLAFEEDMESDRG